MSDILEIIDLALGDSLMSDDAMRWTPAPDEVVRSGVEHPNAERQQEAVIWLAAHGIDGGDVPIDSRLDFDAETLEWVVECYVRDDSGRMRLNPTRDDVERTTVRMVHRGIYPPLWFVRDPQDPA